MASGKYRFQGKHQKQVHGHKHPAQYKQNIIFIVIPYIYQKNPVKMPAVMSRKSQSPLPFQFFLALPFLSLPVLFPHLVPLAQISVKQHIQQTEQRNDVRPKHRNQTEENGSCHNIDKLNPVHHFPISVHPQFKEAGDTV